MELNKLQIKLYEFCHPAKGSSGMELYRQADFLVDGEPLSKVLGIAGERPQCKNTMLDTIPPPPAVVMQFLGKGTTQSVETESERFVLYGCRCGADDCGHISCVLERRDNRIYWKDIRSEGMPEPISHPDLAFNYEDYQEELADYIKRNPTT